CVRVRIGREPMRRMVVRDVDNVAVRIVAAEMPPVERAAAHNERQGDGDRAAQETITRGLRRHALSERSGRNVSCQTDEATVSRARGFLSSAFGLSAAASIGGT